MSDSGTEYDSDDTHSLEENEDDVEEDVEVEEDENKLNQIPNEKIQEFVGVINNKPNWNKCMYCDRYHPPTMHLPGMEYCIHCWAWLNTNQLDLEHGTYTGLNSITDVKTYLKNTFKLHDPTKCVNEDCIYNKIIKFEKDKKLHMSLCVELGFVVEAKPLNAKQVNQVNKVNQTNAPNNFKINNRLRTKINYKLSHVSI